MSHVGTLSKVNMAHSSSGESSLFWGLIIRNFEASMEGKHNERVYEAVDRIMPSRFEPPGRT